MTFRAGNKVNLGRKRADVAARNRSVADVTAEFMSPFEQKWLDRTKLKFNVFVDADMRVARAKQGPPGLGKKYRLRKDAGKPRSIKT